MGIYNNLINHVVFVVDRSGSMNHLKKTTIQVFDTQIKFLASHSQQMSQETRVSIYLFGSQIECVVYDTDVLRLPSLAELYKTEGATKLVDATMKSIEELEETAQRYGDHAFLIYVLTDGGENDSEKFTDYELKKRIENLPENWTLATYVPNQNGVFEAKAHGFPADNIDVWSTTGKGVEEVGRKMEAATTSYFAARSKGIRGSKSLFKLDLSKLAPSTVSHTLEKLNRKDYGRYTITLRNDGVDIKSFVESLQGSYVRGTAYYQLVKPEFVGVKKKAIIVNRQTGNAFEGAAARKLLGLPDNERVRIKPEHLADYDVFILSTSYTRKLPAGTDVIVRK
jgi:hypothetical protein